MSIYPSHARPDLHRGRVGELARLAARQHGVVSRTQLIALGFAEATIDRWVRQGRLIRIHRGVYAVGHDRLRREGRWLAAVLTYGDGAVLSHRSAAAHWDLLSTSASRIDVTVPSPRRPVARDGLRVHRARLHPADRSLRERIPVTSPSRTLLDLADVALPSQLRSAYEASLRLGLFDLRAMRPLLDRSPGRRGLKALGELLAEGEDEPPDLRSELERDFLDLIRAAELPIPSTNVVVEGLLVDAYWPAHGLVVELDSYGYHRSRSQFERDHEGTERLQRAGFEVLRFTRRRVRGQPAAVVRAVRVALERAAARHGHARSA